MTFGEDLDCETHNLSITDLEEGRCSGLIRNLNTDFCGPRTATGSSIFRVLPHLTPSYL